MLDVCKVPYTVVFAKLVPDASCPIQEETCNVLELGVSVKDVNENTLICPPQDALEQLRAAGPDLVDLTNNACKTVAMSYPITVQDFICNFYDENTGEFSMQATPPNIDRIRQELILAPNEQTNWRILNKERDVTTGRRFIRGGADEAKLNLADTVVSQWERDVCVLINDWEVCSANSVLNQLRELSVVSNLSCVPRCAMNIHQLINALAAAEDLAGADKSFCKRQKSINDGYYGFLNGDELALAIRISNENDSASCIELRLNFVISSKPCCNQTAPHAPPKVLSANAAWRAGEKRSNTSYTDLAPPPPPPPPPPETQEEVTESLLADDVDEFVAAKQQQAEAAERLAAAMSDISSNPQPDGSLRMDPVAMAIRDGQEPSVINALAANLAAAEQTDADLRLMSAYASLGLAEGLLYDARGNLWVRKEAIGADEDNPFVDALEQRIAIDIFVAAYIAGAADALAQIN